MSLQGLFRSAKQIEDFERVAINAGYRNFSRRGAFYCHSDLNTFAAGYLAGLKQNSAQVIDVEQVAACV